MRFSNFLVLIALLPAQENIADAQYELVLRDLTVVESDGIKFDRDLVSLANGAHFGWDEVLTANLPDDQQKQFEQFVQELGLPLFRIRHRLKFNDLSSLGEIAERLYKEIANEPTTKINGRRHWLICLGTFRGRLADGNREASLVPLLRMFDIKKKFPAADRSYLTASISEKEFANEFVENLLPMWIDDSAAKETAQILDSHILQNPDQMSDGRLIYFASLLLSAREIEQASQLVSRLKNRNSPLAKKWRLVLATQLEIASQQPARNFNQLKNSYRKLQGNVRVVANYLIASQRSFGKDETDTAVLDLLYISANYGDKFPVISAAAMEIAAQSLEKNGRLKESKIIRSELSERFGKTYHDSLQIHK